MQRSKASIVGGKLRLIGGWNFDMGPSSEVITAPYNAFINTLQSTIYKGKHWSLVNNQ